MGCAVGSVHLDKSDQLRRIHYHFLRHAVHRRYQYAFIPPWVWLYQIAPISAESWKSQTLELYYVFDLKGTFTSNILFDLQNFPVR